MFCVAVVQLSFEMQRVKKEIKKYKKYKNESYVAMGLSEVFFINAETNGMAIVVNFHRNK